MIIYKLIKIAQNRYGTFTYLIKFNSNKVYVFSNPDGTYATDFQKKLTPVYDSTTQLLIGFTDN